MGESKQHHLWAVGVSFGVVSFVSVSLRVYTRTRITRSFGTDDVLIIIAELMALAFLVLLLLGAVNGLGRHIVDISVSEFMMVVKCIWGSSIAYSLQVMAGKLSVLLFYLRIGGPGGSGLPTWCRVSTYSLIFLTIITGIISEIVVIFQCKPFEYQWNQILPGSEGRCWNITIFYFINAGFNIFLDICITILPMPVLLGLELPKRQKAGLCGIFSLGGLVCILSVVRVVQLPALNKTKDITWDTTDAIMWYYIESTLIIIAACGPSLKPLLRLYAPALVGPSKDHWDSYTPKIRGSPHGTNRHTVSGRSFIGDISSLPRGHQASAHISSSRSRTDVNNYGECDSEERIIQEGMGIMKRTDVVLTVEDQRELCRSSSATATEVIGMEILSSVQVDK